MERKINIRIEQEFTKYKDTIKSNILSTIAIIESKDPIDVKAQLMGLLQQLYDYPVLKLESSSFQKQKRTHNPVDDPNKCIAFTATGQRCSRHKTPNHDHCGIHVKGTPYGVIDTANIIHAHPIGTKVHVWAQDFKGIMYYIDDDSNVYDTISVVNGIENPQVIAQYVKNFNVTTGENDYSIPSYNL